MPSGIVLLGQRVLRRRARRLSPKEIGRSRPLIRSMIGAMRRARGVGIAAPQVGKSVRLFIVASQPNARYPRAPAMRPLAMVNPRLLAASKAMKTDWEGCLSIPGIRGKVPRHQRIKIQFTDEAGQQRVALLTGFVARIFQHEFDHINGKVFLDRVRDTRTLMAEPEYRRMMRALPHFSLRRPVPRTYAGVVRNN